MLQNFKTDGILQSRLSPDAYAGGMVGTLPSGVIRHSAPLVPDDYSVLDPYNMYGVDRILLHITMNLRKRMDPEGVLYVVMGEFHPVSSHVMAQAGLLQNLAAVYQREEIPPVLKPVLMVELPFNQLENFLDELSAKSFTDQEKQRIRLADSLGHIFARASIGMNCFEEAPEANNHLLETVLRHNIPLFPVDTGVCRKGETDYLDPDDPVALTVADEAPFKVNLNERKISYCGKRGAKIRNAVMTQRIIAGAAEHKPGIAVIKTGMNHLGNRGNGYPFKTSLPAFLEKSMGPKDHILSVIFECGRYYMPDLDYPVHLKTNRITPLILRDFCDSSHYRGNHNTEPETLSRLRGSYGNHHAPHFSPTPQISRRELKKEILSLLEGVPSLR